jgi:hypothetical protein
MPWGEAGITATEEIRRVNRLQRVEMESGWKVEITRTMWWREDNPGSSTVEGRARKTGETRGRKTKGAGGRYKGTPDVYHVPDNDDVEEF